VQPFLGDDFLLQSEVARLLFHDVAEKLPIVDVHTHLPVEDIESDRVFANLTELWLGDDHYKWRAMRAAGFAEDLVTGNGDPWDKFSAWAATVPRLLHNPLYVWTHLELRRVFGIDIPLSPGTAKEIWEEADRQLPRWSARRLLAHFSVVALSTTDDPTDDLAGHARIREESSGPGVVVVPTWRPDRVHRLLDDPGSWNDWADRLGASTGVDVDDLPSLLAALARSHRRFGAAGARASDHGLARLPDTPADAGLADLALHQVRDGVVPRRAERDALLLEVINLAGRLAHAEASVLQLHLGARRDLSPRLRLDVGPDVGGDAIGDEAQGSGLARLLAGFESQGRLPRCVLYNADPAQNAVFASTAGAFTAPGVGAVVQWGPPWWFNDHEDGLRRHLGELATIGQLAGFVGMLTDARSLLSMTRHELFRRVLCDVIGHEVETGRFPPDMDWLSSVIRDICVSNAVRFFGLPDLAQW
jgi:glucuronate isomerase